MADTWLNRAAHWRAHAAEFGLSNLDGPTIRHMIDDTQRDIDEHVKIVESLKGNESTKREADEMAADISEARKLIETFTAALHVRASA